MERLKTKQLIFLFRKRPVLWIPRFFIITTWAFFFFFYKAYIIDKYRNSLFRLTQRPSLGYMKRVVLYLCFLFILKFNYVFHGPNVKGNCNRWNIKIDFFIILYLIKFKSVLSIICVSALVWMQKKFLPVNLNSPPDGTSYLCAQFQALSQHSLSHGHMSQYKKGEISQNGEGGKRGKQCIHIVTFSICVIAYACLQLCKSLFLHMRKRMRQKIVKEAAGGRQWALYGCRTEKG